MLCISWETGADKTYYGTVMRPYRNRVASCHSFFTSNLLLGLSVKGPRLKIPCNY